MNKFGLNKEGFPTFEEWERWAEKGGRSISAHYGYMEVGDSAQYWFPTPPPWKESPRSKESIFLKQVEKLSTDMLLLIFPNEYQTIIKLKSKSL